MLRCPRLLSMCLRLLNIGQLAPLSLSLMHTLKLINLPAPDLMLHTLMCVHIS